MKIIIIQGCEIRLPVTMDLTIFFLGDLPSVLEILKQRYLNITIKDTMQKIYHMYSHASQPVSLSVS